MPHRYLVLFTCTLLSPLAAQPAPPAQSAPDAVQIVKQMEAIPLSLARDREEVLVTWTTPTVPIRAFEIFRNDNDGMRGRLRIALVRSDREVIFDTLPNSAGKYWYWIKATSYDGQVVNIGPVATPLATVWTP